jgi:dihydrolipoamide dehydrogenase
MYDVIILGSGPGGYVAAAKAGKAGLKTLVIEKASLGGVCLNTGCIPAKAMLASAQRYQEVKDAAAHGIHISGEITFDWSEMQKRKDKVVTRLNKGIQALFKQSHVEWQIGEASVLSPTEVQVGSDTFHTKHIILATGAKPHYPDIPGLSQLIDSKNALSPTEILSLEKIPQKLLILGDNIFAVEYASLFSALGSSVSLLTMAERILPHMDAELSDFLKRELGQQKVEFITQAEIKNLENGKVSYLSGDKTSSLTFDKVLVALGASPNLSGLERLDLTLSPSGFIETDEFLRTSVKGIYAIGDVNGKFPLAHVASKEGIVAVEHILGNEQPIRYDKLPMAVYSLPEVASVGLSEQDAREMYEDVKVSKYFLSANGKALAEGDSKGFVKILSVSPYDEVVGMHVAGNKATDIIAEGVLAMQLEATLHDLASAVHAHPTPSEIIMEAASSSI